MPDSLRYLTFSGTCVPQRCDQSSIDRPIHVPGTSLQPKIGLVLNRNDQRTDRIQLVGTLFRVQFSTPTFGGNLVQRRRFYRKLPALKPLFADYSMILVTTPEPTVLPPSRIAKRTPSSIAIGLCSLDGQLSRCRQACTFRHQPGWRFRSRPSFGNRTVGDSR